MPTTTQADPIAACTLPATIPGLLRRGSPVTSMSGGAGVIFGLPGYDKGRPSLWGICWQFVIHQTDRPPLLDLSDATGRAHAAWWLASQIWRARDHRWRQPIGWFAGAGAWHLVTSGDDPGWASPDRKRGMSVGMEPRTIESLRGLDMADARLLPDGSRWVDAEALRRVCLHVAKENP
jgi:hypothetical protein